MTVVWPWDVHGMSPGTACISPPKMRPETGQRLAKESQMAEILAKGSNPLQSAAISLQFRIGSYPPTAHLPGTRHSVRRNSSTNTLQIHSVLRAPA